MSGQSARRSGTGRGRVETMVGLAAALVTAPVVGQVQIAGTSKGSLVSVKAALVGPDLSVRPVPLLRLELRAAGSNAAVLSVRTSLDGTASASVTPGVYVMLTPTPIRFGDSTYSWSELITVGSGEAKIELTNANALASPAAQSVAPGRPTSTVREVFERAERSVVRVEAGLRSASGFLVGDGLVATNDYVIAPGTEVSVYLDSVTRVPAVVVARHDEVDLALIRMHPSACGDCGRLTLAEPKEVPIIEPGDEILAIGFLPVAGRTMTRGVTSGIRKGAIVADLEIDDTNSGGPVLDLRGEVVGIATAGEVAGTGKTGAVLVTALHDLLATVDSGSSPALEEPRRLPVIPITPVPSEAIAAISDTASVKSYRKFRGMSAGKFQVSLSTPVSLRLLQREEDESIARDRRKRQQRAGLPAAERYTDLKAVQDWQRYVGAEGAPVVTVEITPKLGVTFWSSLFGALETATNQTSTTPVTMKYRGDTKAARFYCNGVEVAPIRGGIGLLETPASGEQSEIKDVANRGYWVLSPEVFRPDSTGAAPVITVEVSDLKNPDNVSRLELSTAVVARVWAEFEQFAKRTEPSEPPMRTPG